MYILNYYRFYCFNSYKSAVVHAVTVVTEQQNRQVPQKELQKCISDLMIHINYIVRRTNQIASQILHCKLFLVIFSLHNLKV